MKLSSIEVIPVHMPILESMRIKDAYGWKQTSEYVVLRITNEAGLEGIGEACFTDVWSGERQAGSVEVIQRVLIPAILPYELFDIRRMLAAMDLAIYGHHASKAAVEMAVLDLMGKTLGVPLYKLLGGKVREAIPVKFSISAINDEARLRTIVDYAMERGIRTIKVKVGMTPEQDLERLRILHDAYGKELSLAIDANNAWRLDEAKRMIKRLEQYELLFIEQPLAREDYGGFRELRQFTSCPIVMDESIFTTGQAWRALQAEAADIYSVYPAKNGGIYKSMQILSAAGMAKKTGLLGSNLELGIGSAAMAHLGIAHETIDDLTYPSDIIGPLYHTDDIITTATHYRDGQVIVPEGPGLGVTIDEEKLRHYSVN
ncbi:mandelate racemase/muconate lactonizing enzyme family protein [Paenibacillus daejeonensis]|uniref:mandelate racemase/muconate lactonizing enzyme family protein n=1 Tax=Paenibacillus daejeonensis TaxID=135193 RepID=UPI00037539F2|nr:enolase C-terminal domain-like protein [Paenibacillus daejeonensis]